jgi:signal peptidase I
MPPTPRVRSRRLGAGAGRSPVGRGTGGGKKRPKSVTNSIVELVVIVLVALGLALGIQAFVVKPYRIPSGSMEPTLSIGQRVLVNRLGMDFGKPHVGEIVVFHPPKGADSKEAPPSCGPVPHTIDLGRSAACAEPVPKSDGGVNFIKRIVAGPGDVMSIVEGHVIRNGKRERDSYTRLCGSSPACNLRMPIKIPAGHWFMMGDNRGESDDSRFWGPVPTSWIIGGAFATYWPPNRIGLL